MDNFFNNHYANRLFLSAILTTFSLNSVAPLPASSSIQKEYGLNEAVVMATLQHAVDKLINSEKKGTDKILDALVNIKSKIESTCNFKINISECLNLVSNELEARGISTPKKEFKAIKKKIKRLEKKQKAFQNHLSNLTQTFQYKKI